MDAPHSALFPVDTDVAARAIALARQIAGTNAMEAVLVDALLALPTAETDAQVVVETTAAEDVGGVATRVAVRLV